MPPARSHDEYTLSIRLAEIEPAIWRRIVVPGQLTLHRLHHILQVTMGWTHSHLHQFIVPGTNESTYYGEPSPEDDYFHKDDRLIRLAQIAPKKGAIFLYEYDFGDSWKHEITVEDIALTPKDEPPYPWCLDGRRACPPEDVGGVGGYQQFLEAWRDRSHPEHQEMRQWVGKHFKPELFSVQQVNAGLALFISLSSKS
jgi:Plasmid pRiA4b ORF-3-like protein